MNKFGGYSAKAQPINRLPYLFILLPKDEADVDRWIALAQRLHFKLVDCYPWFVNGDFTPKSPMVEVAVKKFAAAGIACMLHCFSDLIDPASGMAKDARNIAVDANGKPRMVYEHFIPTRQASAVIAGKLAHAYNSIGFTGGIYFDAIDYYWDGNIENNQRAAAFMVQTVDLIPGGCPTDAAGVYAEAFSIRCRYGACDTPLTEIKAWVDAHVKDVQETAGMFVPFMGWLDLQRTKLTIPEAHYYLTGCHRIGGGYGLEGVTPDNIDDPVIGPIAEEFGFYNSLLAL